MLIQHCLMSKTALMQLALYRRYRPFLINIWEISYSLVMMQTVINCVWSEVLGQSKKWAVRCFRCSASPLSLLKMSGLFIHSFIQELLQHPFKKLTQRLSQPNQGDINKSGRTCRILMDHQQVTEETIWDKYLQMRKANAEVLAWGTTALLWGQSNTADTEQQSSHTCR